jgi:hypothetical protein
MASAAVTRERGLEVVWPVPATGSASDVRDRRLVAEWVTLRPQFRGR